MSYRRDGVLTRDRVDQLAPSGERLVRGPVAIVECVESIPCNPCVEACSKGAITIDGGINEIPVVDFERCDGCGLCISACPGLAIFVVDASGEGDTARILLPHEFVPLPEIGEIVTALDREGTEVGDAEVLRVLASRALDRTPIVSLAAPKKQAMIIRHFRRKGTPV